MPALLSAVPSTRLSAHRLRSYLNDPTINTDTSLIYQIHYPSIDAAPSCAFVQFSPGGTPGIPITTVTPVTAGVISLTVPAPTSNTKFTNFSVQIGGDGCVPGSDGTLSPAFSDASPFAWTKPTVSPGTPMVNVVSASNITVQFTEPNNPPSTMYSIIVTGADGSQFTSSVSQGTPGPSLRSPSTLCLRVSTIRLS